MRGSHKVPGIVVQHSNGRIYDKAYLITFKVGPLRTHTLAPSILPLLDALVEGFFWNLPEFGRRFRFCVLYGAKRVPLRPIFRIGNSRKSPGARFREYGGWVMTGMLFSVRNCNTTSDVWLSASSWCRNHSEQTSHWQVSSSNRRTKSREWIRERHQLLVTIPRWPFFDDIESVVALF